MAVLHDHILYTPYFRNATLGRDSFVDTHRRFALFYEEPNSNLRQLGGILNHYRTLPEGTAFADAALNQKEKQIVADVDHLLDDLFSTPELRGMAQQRELLLRLSYIKRLSFAPGDSHPYMLESVLGNTLLQHRDQATLAMDSLQKLSSNRMSGRDSMGRSDLRRHLQNRGFELRDSPDFSNDFRKLEDWSTEEIALDQTNGRDILRVGTQTMQIIRPVQQELSRAATGKSFLVIGEAGVGKTGALLKLATDLVSAGRRVWYL